MLKQIFTMSVILLLVNLALVPFVYGSNSSKETEFAEKVKANIKKLGVGTDSKIKVKLKDGTKIKGYVSEISNDEFLVVNEKDGQNTAVPYPQVKQAQGNSWSTRTTISLAIGIGIFAFLIIAVATAKN